MQTINNLYLNIDKRIYFFFFIAFVLVLTYVAQELFITEDIYYATLGEQLSYERIKQMLSMQAKWAWIGYAVMPLIYLVKFSLVALCLLCATVFMEVKISFKRLFQVALLTEVVFLLPILIKVVWLGAIAPPETLEEVTHFYPLSVINLFGVENLNAWEIYPLQLFNAFEIVYWFLLAYGIAVFSEAGFHKSFRMVLSGYAMVAA